MDTSVSNGSYSKADVEAVGCSGTSKTIKVELSYDDFTILDFV